jgi:anhydro-N-acetylmuramic acid kinase
MQPEYYIGLMSGTSADGIDLTLVDFSQKKPQLIAKFYQPYKATTQKLITDLYLPGENEIDRLGHLDKLLAEEFNQAISKFLEQQKLTADDIIAIGSHGQTIRHRPTVDKPFTLQIGCNQSLASQSGIRVIGQFRRKDVVLGGQGAPLVPAVHQAIFSEQKNDVFVVNIGGIANISYLPSTQSKKSVLGFDTGPGNALLDDWYQVNHPHAGISYDNNGQWAATGQCHSGLLDALLSDAYFQKAAPKSTGREDFHLSWLKKHINRFALASEDIQATLVELTAQSIALSVKSLSDKGLIYLCGGGAQNQSLVTALTRALDGYKISYTQDKGIDSDCLEAFAFAWLAYAFDHNINGNIPAVTGASRATVLGLEYRP